MSHKALKESKKSEIYNVETLRYACLCYANTVSVMGALLIILNWEPNGWLIYGGTKAIIVLGAL